MAEVKIREGSLEIEVVANDKSTVAKLFIPTFKEKVTKVTFEGENAAEYVSNLVVGSKA